MALSIYMDSTAVIYALCGLVGLWIATQAYSRTELQRAKIEHDASVTKAETYANRHIQQAKYEAMGYQLGFQEPVPNVDLSSLGVDPGISQLLPLLQSPQIQELLAKFLKKE